MSQGPRRTGHGRILIVREQPWRLAGIAIMRHCLAILLVAAWLGQFQLDALALELRVLALPNTQGDDPYSKFQRDTI